MGNCASAKVVLMAAGVFACLAACAGLVVYPEYPAAIERDGEYEVSVTQGAAAARLTPWKRYELQFETDFDPAVTDLVALSILATAPADEIEFRDLVFRR